MNETQRSGLPTKLGQRQEQKKPWKAVFNSRQQQHEETHLKTDASESESFAWRESRDVLIGGVTRHILLDNLPSEKLFRQIDNVTWGFEKNQLLGSFVTFEWFTFSQKRKNNPLRSILQHCQSKKRNVGFLWCMCNPNLLDQVPWNSHFSEECRSLLHYGKKFWSFVCVGFRENTDSNNSRTTASIYPNLSSGEPSRQTDSLKHCRDLSLILVPGNYCIAVVIAIPEAWWWIHPA